MMKYVVAVEALGAHRLRLRFDDGAEGVVDLDEHIEWGGVFEPLRDEAEFAKVASDGVTAVWPSGADIDPLVLYGWLTGRDPLAVLRERPTARRRRHRPASARTTRAPR